MKRASAAPALPASLTARSELARKTLHIAMGGFAFLLRYLTWWQAALCALAALLFNLFVLPRLGGRRLFRGAAATRGHDIGIVLYPASVLALILLLPGRPEIVAAAWGLLAFGDGMATVIGVTLGRVTGALPWNRDKSWAGLAGFLLGGIPMSVALYAWTLLPRIEESVGINVPLPGPVALRIAIVGAIVALIETLDLGLDDNVVVPFAGAAFLYGAWLVDPARVTAGLPIYAGRLPWALGVNLALGALAFALRGVSISGLVHGILLGTATWLLAGPRGFAIMAIFFVLGTAASRVGLRTKQREGTAQEEGGRRGARHAWANAGGPLLFAALGAWSPLRSPLPALFSLAFVAAYATALADTLGSEIGQAFGRRTILVTTFRPVPRGTDGAVSLEGTVAGLLGAVVVGGAAFSMGVIAAGGVAWVVIGALFGTTLESYLGALLERRHLIANEAQNFLNTLAGGLSALALAAWLG